MRTLNTLDVTLLDSFAKPDEQQVEWLLSQELAGVQKHIFNVENLQPGMYFIHVTTGNSRETVKLIKM